MTDELTKKEIEYVLRVLRKGTLGSAARNECLARARKRVLVGTYKNGKQKWKFHWQCATCREWWPDSTVLEVDHIKEIGGFKGDWHEIVMRMYFCGQGNLQALCSICHQKKSSNYNAKLKYKRKKS